MLVVTKMTDISDDKLGHQLFIVATKPALLFDEILGHLHPCLC